MTPETQLDYAEFTGSDAHQLTGTMCNEIQVICIPKAAYLHNDDSIALSEHAACLVTFQTSILNFLKLQNAESAMICKYLDENDIVLTLSFIHIL